MLVQIENGDKDSKNIISDVKKFIQIPEFKEYNNSLPTISVKLEDVSTTTYSLQIHASDALQGSQKGIADKSQHGQTGKAEDPVATQGNAGDPAKPEINFFSKTEREMYMK